MNRNWFKWIGILAVVVGIASAIFMYFAVASFNAMASLIWGIAVVISSAITFWAGVRYNKLPAKKKRPMYFDPLIGSIITALLGVACIGGAIALWSPGWSPLLLIIGCALIVASDPNPSIAC